MRSLDFEEFLWTCGYRDEQISGLLDPILAHRPFGEAAKGAMDRRFVDYCVLGGMPEVLETYFVKGTFERIPVVQRRILDDYRDDVRKYAEGLDPVRIQVVFDSIPRQLAKENSTLEMDFFLRSQDRLVPIEVKGENGRAQSLRTLIRSDTAHGITWGIKLINGNVGFEDSVLTLPQWCAFLLPKVAEEFPG